MAARRRLLIASAAVAAVIVGAAIALDATGDSPSTATAPASAGASTAPGATATAAGTDPAGAGSATPTAIASTAPPSVLVPGTATAAQPDPAAPLEVSGPAPEDTGLPVSTPRPAAIGLPLPPAASADGSLVAGYPSDVVGPLPGSFLGASSVAPDGDVLRAGLSATIELDAATITERYRASLELLGFTSAVADAPAGGTATLFTAGTDSVSLSTAPTGTSRTSYSLVAVLHAPSGG